MSDVQVNLVQFDEWLKNGSDVAALVMRQWLEPVEGEDAIIFPPTYLEPEDWPRYRRDEAWPGYNIDHLPDGSSVCQIDSVGSQANRMEPIFKCPRYDKLVPQVIVKAGKREINLLDAGHRAADAIVRFSSLWQTLESAFAAAKNGDAEPLAKIAPTSLVFGAWDSRATQVKLPRIVRSVIRALGAQPIHRSATYIPAVEYVNEGLLDEPEGKTQQDSMSQLGLRHAPASWTHGGIRVSGEIRRDAALNLAALRTLAAANSGESRARTLALRRYILGLSLVSFTAPQETFLREGCQLVPDATRPAEWLLVRHDGKREPIDLSHDQALNYAEIAAQDFKVGESRTVAFDAKGAKAEIGKSKEERKKARRS